MRRSFVGVGVLAFALFILIGNSATAAPQNDKGDKNEKGKGNSNAAEISALKAQIEKLRHEEPAAIRQLDEQFKAAIARLEKPEEREKRERARLENEEKEALKRIDERFQSIIQHLEPKEVRNRSRTEN